MTHPRRRSIARVVASAAASLALALGVALPASASSVATLVPGSVGFQQIVAWNGLLYGGTDQGLSAFDGTTMTLVPGSPTSPSEFVEYDGDLWMIAQETGGGDNSLWRYDGSVFEEFVAGAALLQPPVVAPDGLLYLVTAAEVAPGVFDTFLTSTDGTQAGTFAVPASPNDVGVIALDPNGFLVLTAGADETLWTYDGVAVFAAVTLGGDPVQIPALWTLPASGVVAFPGEETATPGTTYAYVWDGATVQRYGSATSPWGFVEYLGAVYYVANDGGERLMSATPSVAGSEAAVTPSIPGGYPDRVLGGVLYLSAENAAGDNTPHTFDGTTLTELTPAVRGGWSFTEYGGDLYFLAQIASETPGLWRLDESSGVPAAPTLPPTGFEVSPLLIAVAAVLVVGGAVILVVARHRRA